MIDQDPSLKVDSMRKYAKASTAVLLTLALNSCDSKNLGDSNTVTEFLRENTDGSTEQIVEVAGGIEVACDEYDGNIEAISLAMQGGDLQLFTVGSYIGLQGILTGSVTCADFDAATFELQFAADPESQF